MSVCEILVFPFTKKSNNIKYCLFKKKNEKEWKSIESTCEKDRSVMDTAKRRTWDISGIVMDSRMIKFDRKKKKSKIRFLSNYTCEKSITECRECCFGVEVKNEEIIAGGQMEYKWLSYKEAVSMLEKEEDKKALCELNSRLN